MGDIRCAVCNEPWDSYGVRNGDMEPEDADKFLRGKGCPSCGFASTCPDCSGTGREPSDYYTDECPTCNGRRSVTVRRLYKWPADRPWEYRYVPNVARVPAGVKLEWIGEGRSWSCADGLARERRAVCWTCKDTAPKCPRCDGTGKFKHRNDQDREESEERAARFDVARDLSVHVEDMITDLED